MSNNIEKTETKADTVTVRSPRMGEVINVKAAPGRMVMNNESGGYFDEKTAVSVSVDVRILRLLQDQDLIRTK